MVSGSHGGDGGMVGSGQLRSSEHWRRAVRGLRLAGFGLLVAVAGLVTRVWSTGTGLTILAVGVVIYLIGFVVVYSGFIPAIRALPKPRPSFWKFRRILMSDALHLRS
jgi:predicted membrane channel-forming protein YqfA (hemolysin III family)